MIDRVRADRRIGRMSTAASGGWGQLKGRLSAAYPAISVKSPGARQVRAPAGRLRLPSSSIASAAASLDEGLDEPLPLHRLGVFSESGTSRPNIQRRCTMDSHA